MRKILAIVVCKLVRFVGKLVGKGSSLPGKYALKLCPDILSREFTSQGAFCQDFPSPSQEKAAQGDIRLCRIVP